MATYGFNEVANIRRRTEGGESDARSSSFITNWSGEARVELNANSH